MIRLDISELMRAAGIRRKAVTLRPIEPTGAQADRLYRIYVQPVTRWASAVSDRILPEYARSLSQITTDSPADLQFTIDEAEGGIVRAIFSWRELFRSFIADFSQWHMARFTANLKYATNVDMRTILAVQNETETLQSVLNRNVALIRSISDQSREKISDIVFRGLTNRTPARDVAKEISTVLGGQKARARRIASDQLTKMSAALDEDRMRSIGINSFQWMHSDKRHFRPWHKARDGKVFKWDDPEIKNDKPGYAPFCGCKARGYIGE